MLAPSFRVLLALVALAVLVHVAPPTRLQAAAPCQPPRPHASGSFNETIVSGGLTRQYILHIPLSYTGEQAAPLVLNLHGYGSNAQNQAIYSGLPAKADDSGFVLVMPQGTGAQPHWNFTTIEPGAPDDVQFIGDLLDALAAQLCIDPARIYATGISNGAAMSVRLACNLSKRIAAIAPVAGVYFPLSCPSTRPVPVIAFHGTADPLVPYTGGVTPQGYPVPPIPDSIADWAQHNGCATPALETQVTANVRLLRYDGCADGAVVELYVIEGGGHTWPDAIIDLPLETFGATTHEISANDLMWEFFAGGSGIGGMAEPPEVDSPPPQPPEGSGSSARLIPAIAAGAGVLAGAGWYAGRRFRYR